MCVEIYLLLMKLREENITLYIICNYSLVWLRVIVNHYQHAYSYLVKLSSDSAMKFAGRAFECRTWLLNK